MYAFDFEKSMVPMIICNLPPQQPAYVYPGKRKRTSETIPMTSFAPSKTSQKKVDDAPAKKRKGITTAPVLLFAQKKPANWTPSSQSVLISNCARTNSGLPLRAV